MCGIVGYIGPRDVPSLLTDGLRRLEYRGYDSCGIGVLENGCARVVRAVGRIQNLEEKLRRGTWHAPAARCGIAHTRWATHGRPSEENAHPHCDCSGQFLVVHNGIIENYLEIRQKLLAEGHHFNTETDTEVLPHLMESYFCGSLENAVRAALQVVRGVYAVVAISPRDGYKIVAARKGPPLAIGFGQGENFVGSDPTAFLPHTREVLFLEDRDLAVVRRDSVDVLDFEGRKISRTAQHVQWSTEVAEKEGYPHFMLKEIFQQPHAIRDTICGRLKDDGSVMLEEEAAAPEIFSCLERIHIVACGTSLNAALAGKFMIETLARLPVEVDYASEFRYRNPILKPGSLVVAITQSGETADTLAALCKARQKGAFLLSICNVVGSTAARQSDGVLYTRAGPEIGVASTKTFTAQLAALNLLALFLGGLRGSLPPEEMRRRVQCLKQIPGQIEKVLQQNAAIQAAAERFAGFRNCLYLGRGISYPIALEGALKLKEISYIPAEGYPAGEMKHGPIALIDRATPAVVVAPRDALHRKTMSNIEEVKARGGVVLAVGSDGDGELAQRAAQTFLIPKVDFLLSPLLSVVPLQLLAYHVGIARGCDVDKPRNLAKSVTVE